MLIDSSDAREGIAALLLQLISGRVKRRQSRASIFPTTWEIRFDRLTLLRCGAIMVGRVEPLIRLFAGRLIRKISFGRGFSVVGVRLAGSFLLSNKLNDNFQEFDIESRVALKFRGSLLKLASFEKIRAIFPFSSATPFAERSSFPTPGYGLHPKTPLPPFGHRTMGKKLSPISWKESIRERQSRGTIGLELIRR